MPNDRWGLTKSEVEFLKSRRQASPRVCKLNKQKTGKQRVEIDVLEESEIPQLPSPMGGARLSHVMHVCTSVPRLTLVSCKNVNQVV